MHTLELGSSKARQNLSVRHTHTPSHTHTAWEKTYKHTTNCPAARAIISLLQAFSEPSNRVLIILNTFCVPNSRSDTTFRPRHLDLDVVLLQQHRQEVALWLF